MTASKVRPTSVDVSLLKQLWSHIEPKRKRQFSLLLLCLLLASVAEVASIGLTLPFLAAITAPQEIINYAGGRLIAKWLDITESQQFLLPMCLTFAAAAVLAGTTRTLLLFGQTRLAHAVGADISDGIYRRTLYQPFEKHFGRNTSEAISSIIHKTDSVVYHTILPSIGLISSTILLTAILITLLWASSTVALMAFFSLGAIYAIIVVTTRHQLSQNSSIISIEATRSIQSLNEGYGGIRDILIDGTQEAFSAEYHDSNIRLRRAAANVQIISGLPRFAIEALAMSLLSGIAYVSLATNQGDTRLIPTLGVLAIGAQRLLPLLQLAFASWTSIQSSGSSLKDTLAYLNEPLPDPRMTQPASPLQFQQAIVLKDLGYKYPHTETFVFRHLNLTIPKGARVGFIGATGSGKSTLIDIIMGLLKPTEGDIEVDGVSITTLHAKAWQANIAHVPQAIYLSDKSVADNVTFGSQRESRHRADIIHAVNASALNDIIEQWPRRLDTLVGENGARLSGGQRQRIGIARAIYRRTTIIVLDEATSALDSTTESIIMNGLYSADPSTTLLIIAHRLSTLSQCDFIVQLQPQLGMLKILTYGELVADLESHES